MNKLLISEDFYSIQGEGKSSGVPSYFIRLANCNLTCGATTKFVNQFKKEEMNYDPGTFQGDLHKEGKATWTCDTIPVWTKGTERDFQYLVDKWKEQDIFEDIRQWNIHLIITGGEPCIPKHQKSIIEFIKYLNEEEKLSPFIEIETNGTLYIEDDLYHNLDQINCSPKLSNSGISKNKRIIPAALERIKYHDNYQLKFVISDEKDVQEIFEDYINPFRIPLQNIICMPGLDSQKDFHERTRFVMEMAMKYKFIGLTRLHVSAWDKTTGC